MKLTGPPAGGRVATARAAANHGGEVEERRAGAGRRRGSRDHLGDVGDAALPGAVEAVGRHRRHADGRRPTRSDTQTSILV